VALIIPAPIKTTSVFGMVGFVELLMSLNNLTI